jgi:prevent-host-death family protein
MKALELMEKTISAFEARRQFGKLLNDISGKGDRVVVERHGEAVAVVVPIEVYEQWKRSRAEFFDRMRAVADRANLTPQEADELAAEAVGAVRTHSR